MTTPGAGAGGFASRLGSLGPAGWFRLVLAVVVAGFLVYYVGPRTIGTTLLKVVVAVGLSAALFIGANKLFDLAYDAWAQFCAIAGFVVGFVAFAALDGNHILRELPARPWLWGLIGGAAVGAVMLALTTLVPDGSDEPAPLRLPIAAGGLAALGLLFAVAVVDHRQPGLDWAKLIVTTLVGAAAFAAARALSARRGTDAIALAALTGAAVGWFVGAWGGAEFASVAPDATEATGGGNFGETLLATVIPLGLIGVAIGLRRRPGHTRRRYIEQRSRAWIFVTPALLFISGGLLIPLVRTVLQSFKNNDSSQWVGFKNYHSVITSDGFFDGSNWKWDNVLGSRLFWIAVVVAAIGILIGIVNGRTVKRPFESTPGSTIALIVAFFFIACLVLGTLRGSIVNNLWWVIVVTLISTALGLAVAVLADRAKGENIAKSLIFLPMAISFVGAGVIWTLIYQTKNVTKPQTGVLNALWIGLGELSNSDWQKVVVSAAILLIVAGLVWLAWTGIRDHQWSRTGFSGGIAGLLVVFVVLLLGRGLGGFVETEDGVRKAISNVVGDQPFNNMWLMVVLIWIQTGFGMVIFSSAIKAVPTEFMEAAKIDGATDAQTFWRVTLPQILPTIGVVVTTLIVAVMKVYDIIVVMTGGQFSTSVIAFDMIQQISFSNFGFSATFATLLFLAIVPVMVYNIRNMQKAHG